MLLLSQMKKISLVLVMFLLFASCKSDFKANDYVAYFGGEIVNPRSSYVYFCKDNEVIDTLKLDKKNRFFIQFDSLAPGLYTFKHEPEYQYVYFDKNDSLMVRVNTKDFDASLAFCGRGDEKNNFLIEQYLRNEKDRNNMFSVFEYDLAKFQKSIDSTHRDAQNFYTTKKNEIKWSDEFDKFALSSVDLPHYSKKELYPMMHKMRTGEDVYEKIPKNFYDYRKTIDCNNAALSTYSPFVNYLSHLLNNMASINYHNHFSDVDLSLKTNINKLNIADTLIKNEKIKNIILNNIAFQYLLEDQNIVNNNIFIDTYYKYSTDKSYKNEILKIGNAIQLLKPNYELPAVELIDKQDNKLTSDKVILKNTVVFLWTSKSISHLEAVHKKVIALKKKYPKYQFIAINVNDTQKDWKNLLSNYKFDGITELRSTNFEDLKAKWAINKIQRTIVMNEQGKIKNAFTNIFEVDFEENLK